MHNRDSHRVRRWAWTLAISLGAMAGCQSTPGHRFPPTWAQKCVDAQGRTEFRYATHAGAAPDRGEIIGDDGRVVALTRRRATSAWETVTLADIPDDERLDLVIILDSIPYSMVADLWQHGRFRLFHPPSRVIAPFPVMTDLAMAELFGTSPSPGVEARKYDGNRMSGGVGAYVGLENSSWLENVDVHRGFGDHGLIYLWPGWGLEGELAAIAGARFRSDAGCVVGYCVGTSAFGAKYGRNGHQEALIRLDQFCQALVHESGGRVRITLLSDHGHDLAPGRRVPLPERLADFGYRLTDRLERPGDIVYPEFGMVTCAALYCDEPQRPAADIAGLEGIGLVAYREGEGRVVVLSRSGEAVIEKKGDGFSYVPGRGDPLKLGAAIDRLRADGRMRADGSAADADWFEATADHEYPDVIYRSWRGFHGLTERPPDILVSVEEGWFCGDKEMADFYPMSAAHGNLAKMSSTAFVMSMAGPLAEVMRTERVLAGLDGVGVKVRRSERDLRAIRTKELENQALPEVPSTER